MICTNATKQKFSNVLANKALYLNPCKSSGLPFSYNLEQIVFQWKVDLHLVGPHTLSLQSWHWPNEWGQQAEMLQSSPHMPLSTQSLAHTHRPQHTHPHAHTLTRGRVSKADIQPLQLRI